MGARRPCARGGRASPGATGSGSSRYYDRTGVSAVDDTDRPFGIALRELLIENDYTTEGGRPNWASFASQLPGIHYETLRRAAVGERPPSVRLMEACARALRIPSEYFLEYRAYLARREFDPQHVGAEQAARNLAAWARAPGRKIH